MQAWLTQHITSDSRNNACQLKVVLMVLRTEFWHQGNLLLGLTVITRSRRCLPRWMVPLDSHVDIKGHLGDTDEFCLK